jgi:hypothetical protein
MLSIYNSRVCFFSNSEFTMPKVKKKSVAQKLREEKEKKRKQQAANTVARRLTRQDPARRRQEQVADTESHRLARQDPARRRQEQVANTESHRLARQDPARRRQLQLANTESHRLARQDPARRRQEQAANTESHRLARKDTVIRSVERKTFWESERKRRQTAKSTYEKLMDKYIDQIRQSPSYICSCCGGLWYEKSTSVTSQEALILCGCNQDFIDSVLRVQQDQHRLCGTCKKSINQKCVPRLCLSNGFDFPFVPSEIKVTV